jgi:hypothetical protein
MTDWHPSATIAADEGLEEESCVGVPGWIGGFNAHELMVQENLPLMTTEAVYTGAPQSYQGFHFGPAVTLRFPGQLYMGLPAAESLQATEFYSPRKAMPGYTEQQVSLDAQGITDANIQVYVTPETTSDGHVSLRNQSPRARVQPQEASPATVEVGTSSFTLLAISRLYDSC